MRYKCEQFSILVNSELISSDQCQRPNVDPNKHLKIKQLRQQAASGRLCSILPLRRRPDQVRLLRATFRWGLNASRDGNFHPPLGPGLQGSTIPSWGETSLLSNWNFPWYSLCSLALAQLHLLLYSHSSDSCREQQRLLLLLHSPSSQLLLVCPRLQVQPFWTESVIPCLVWGRPKPDPVLRSGLSSVSREENPHPSSCWLHCHYYSPGCNQPSLPEVYPIAESHIAEG